MGSIVRGTILLAFAGGGVWGAYRLLDVITERIEGTHFHTAEGGIFLMLPVGLLGALVGLFIGGLLLPRKH